jgi:hypothetical protein
MERRGKPSASLPPHIVTIFLFFIFFFGLASVQLEQEKVGLHILNLCFSSGRINWRTWTHITGGGAKEKSGPGGYFCSFNEFMPNEYKKLKTNRRIRS